MGYFRPLSQTKFINDANLVRYYPFDGNSTDSKNGYNGTDTSVSYSTSYSAGANFVQGVHYTGSGSHIIANNTSLPTGASAFTTVFWFKTSTAGTQAFYGYGTAGANGYRNSVMIVSNKFYFSGFGADLDSAVTVNDGVIHQGVVTYNGTTMKIFVDGVKKNSGSITLNVQSGTSFYLGENSQTDTFYTGDMDDFAMFSRELTEGEVAELYQSQTLGEYTGAGSGTTKLLLHLNGSSADSSGNNNNGTDTAITYSQANGKFGQGAGFNGSSSYIQLNSNTLCSFERTDAFTFSFWFNSASSAYFEPITKTLNSGTYRGYHTGISITGAQIYLALVSTDSSNEATMYVTPSPALATSTWYHIVITYSGNSNTSGMTFYVNGNVQTNRTSVVNSLSATIISSNVFQLGGRAGANLLLNGKMDEVIVENVEWSATTVKKIYTKQKGRFGII